MSFYSIIKRPRYGNSRRQRFLLLFILICFWNANLMAAPPLVIKTFKSVNIYEKVILLGKISQISGEDKKMIQILKQIKLGRAPLPGKSRFLDGDYIKIKLRQAGIDLTQIDLQAEKNIQVVRSFQEISKQQIRNVIHKYLTRNMPWDKNQARIKRIKVDRSIKVPRGRISTIISIPPQNDFLGNLPVSVDLSVNQIKIKRVWATAYIEVLTDVVLAKKPLGRNQIISKKDVVIEKMDLANLPADIITQIADVIGKRVKKKLKPGTVLRKDFVTLPAIVKKGDLVLIIAQSKDLMITTQGIIKEKGRVGDRIRVVNLDSNKTIYARVKNSSTVQVNW